MTMTTQDKLQAFIKKYKPEADSVLLDDGHKLAFYAGPDPIKRLTVKQVKEYAVIDNQLEIERAEAEYQQFLDEDAQANAEYQEELRREDEIKAHEKLINVNISNSIKPRAPATRYSS